MSTLCARKYCNNYATIIVGDDPLCGEHDELEKITKGGVKCRHCGIKMVSKTDFRPIFGKNHRKSCPRSYYNTRG